MTPLLPLDEFRRILGYNPYHYWQLANAKTPITSSCNELVFQYAWQNTDAIGRSEILNALEDAEEKIETELGYGVAPHCNSETVPIPRYFDPRQNYSASWDTRGRWLSLQLREGHVQTMGVCTIIPLGNVAATLSDVDSDGINDTFTCSIATAITDPGMIAVYFTAADRFDGSDISDRWRIEPVTVTIVAGTATVKGHAWNIVRQVLYEGVGKNTLDPATAGNFATTLTIAQRAIDTTQQGYFIWETIPGDACMSGCSLPPGSLNAIDPSAQYITTARFTVRNAEIGIVAGEVAAYNAITGVWGIAPWALGYPPDRAIVNYSAGDSLDGQRMNQRWANAVTNLAAALMAKPISGCDVANRHLALLQQDLGVTPGGDGADTPNPSFTDLDCPWGTRRGAVLAYKSLGVDRLVHAVITA